MPRGGQKGNTNARKKSGEKYSENEWVRFTKTEVMAYNRAKAEDQKLVDWVRATLNKAANIQPQNTNQPES